MDRSRIALLYLSHQYTPHDRRFLRAFREADMDVSFLCWEEQALEKRSLPDGVRLMQWPSSSGPKKMPRTLLGRIAALRILRQEWSIDVVIAGPVQTGTLAAAMVFRCPVMAMSWGSDMLVTADTNLRNRFLTSLALRRSSAAICDCQAVQSALIRYSRRRLRENDIIALPWGIDLDEFRPRDVGPEARQQLGWSSGKVIISTRSWESLYAVDTLVKAIALLRARDEDVRLILLGDGSQAPLIRRLVEEHQLSSRVSMPGRVSNEQTADYFCMSDLYVSTAPSDGTSISMLEAMACGLPVIVSEGYGNVEWVSPGTNGWLVPPKDPERLADMITRALEDGGRCQAIGATNRDLVCARADWSRNKRQLMDFICHVARGAGGR